MAQKNKKEVKRNINVFIPDPKLPNNKIRFSFEYYDNTNKYCLSCWNKDAIIQALKRLGEINEKTYNEIIQQKKTFRFHPIDWQNTKEKEGFPNVRVNLLDPYQFALVGINYGKARVFGAYSNNVFYIVWFDLHHLVDPVSLKNT